MQHKPLFIFFISLFLSGALRASPVNSDVIVNCQKFEAPLSGGFCIHRPKALKNKDIVYYLHGKGNSEKTWQDDFYFPRQIREFWTANQMDFPTVVSISFGPIWVLAEKNASPVSGLFEAMTKMVIPSIEHILGGLKGRRILVGESMGGFNSIQLALKTTLFEKAGIVCAPMAEKVSPFSTPEETKAFIEHSVGWQYYKDHDPETVKTAVGEMMQLSRGFFPTPEDFKGANPLTLAAEANPKITPTLYIANGFYDRYLSYESTETFVKLLKNRGVKTSWRPQWGGHCSIDIPTLARFLVN